MAICEHFLFLYFSLCETEVITTKLGLWLVEKIEALINWRKE